MKSWITFLLVISAISSSIAQELVYELKENIPYYNTSIMASDAYISERCVLDIYYPKNTQDFATIVWFHGGGLVNGEKFVPEALTNKELAVIAVNYRLSPRAKALDAIKDAAAAVSWVFKNIKSYGGDPNLIFVSGHSAGGYLTSMIGLDRSYLQIYEIDANSIAGLIPFSGHTITHLTVRSEQGVPDTQPIVDQMAPLYHVRADAPPMLLITGDRDMEMLGRYEENAYFWRMMKLNGHRDIELFELEGYDHGGMANPAFPLLVNEVKRISGNHKD